MLKLMQEPAQSDAPLRDGEWELIADRLGFSPREVQIVRYVLTDAKERTIAHRLGISTHTVHTHLKRIYSKLGVNGRVELILRIFSEYADHTRTINKLHETPGAMEARKAA